MKQIIDFTWLYLRSRLGINRGEMTLYMIVGGLLLAGAYFAYPAPFHKFVSTTIDQVLEIARDSFSGGSGGNPDKTRQVK